MLKRSLNSACDAVVGRSFTSLGIQNWTRDVWRESGFRGTMQIARMFLSESSRFDQEEFPANILVF